MNRAVTHEQRIRQKQGEEDSGEEERGLGWG